MCESDSSKIICRASDFTYTLGCRFDRRLNVTTIEGVNVSTKKSFTLEKKTKTNITATMQFYTNNLFAVVASSPLSVSFFFFYFFLSVSSQFNQAITKHIKHLYKSGDHGNCHNSFFTSNNSTLSFLHNCKGLIRLDLYHVIYFL